MFFFLGAFIAEQVRIAGELGQARAQAYAAKEAALAARRIMNANAIEVHVHPVVPVLAIQPAKEFWAENEKDAYRS